MSKSITAKVQEAIAANRAKVAKPRAAKLKATVIEEPVQPTVQAQTDEFVNDVGGLFRKYKIAMPSGTRVVLSFLASAVFGGALGYFGGTLLSYAVALATYQTPSFRVTSIVAIKSIATRY
jgi:hypothetical protein